MSLRSKILITTRIHEDGLRLLEREFEVTLLKRPLNLLSCGDFVESGKDCRGIVVVTNVERVTKEVIDALPKLMIIARHGVGFDNVDVKAASERGIYVTTAPVLDETVADQAFALLLCLARRTCEGHQFVMSRQWKTKDPYMFMATDVWGKTMGIIGLGRIGSKIAQRARGFAMRVLYFDVVRKTDLESQLRVEYQSLKELLKQSDIVVMACPLTNDTRHMIGEEEFASMKKSAFLINVARGEIVDHEAMVRAVRHRVIGGVGLDVFDKEPIPIDDPLLGLDNVVLTPHLSANTIECRRRMALTVAEDVLRVLRGQTPRYAVNSRMLAATS